MSDGYFQKLDDVEAVEMLPGIFRRTMATTDEAMLCRFLLKAGAEVPYHQHMNDQVGTVISGVVQLTVADQIQVLHAGDSYAIPGGIMHSAKALEEAVVIDIFSPPREDYRTEAR